MIIVLSVLLMEHILKNMINKIWTGLSRLVDEHRWY